MSKKRTMQSKVMQSKARTVACPACGFGNTAGQSFCGSCRKELVKPNLEQAFPSDAETSTNRSEKENPAKRPLPPKYASKPNAVPLTAPPLGEKSIPSSDISKPAFQNNPQNLQKGFQKKPWAKKNAFTGSEIPLSSPSLQMEITEAPPEKTTAHQTTLKEVAILSLEAINLTEILSLSKNTAYKEAALTQFQEQIQAVMASYNGEIAFGNHMGHPKNAAPRYQVVFSLTETTPQSVELAVTAGIALLNTPIEVLKIPISLRIGLDVARLQERHGTAGVIERTIAAPNTMILSPKALSKLSQPEQFSLEPVGPIEVGNQFQTFYQCMGKPNQAKTSAWRPNTESFIETETTHLTSNTPEASLEKALTRPVETASERPFSFAFDMPEEAPSEQPHATRNVAMGFEPISVPPPARSKQVEDASLEDTDSGTSLSAKQWGPVVEAADPWSANADVWGMDHWQQPASTRRGSLTEILKEIVEEPFEAFGEYRIPRSPSHSLLEATEATYLKLDQFIQNPEFQSISIIGPEGSGKTKLIESCRLQLSEQATWLRGETPAQYGPHDYPLAFWVDTFRRFMGFGPSHLVPQETKKVTARMLNLVFKGQVPNDTLETLYDLLSLNPLQPLSIQRIIQSQNRLVEALYQWFAALCQMQNQVQGQMKNQMSGEFNAGMPQEAQRKPLIFVVDDWQRMDDASANILLKLFAQKPFTQLPICFCWTYDPAFYPVNVFEKVLSAYPHHAFNLAPLSLSETQWFIQTHLWKQPDPKTSPEKGFGDWLGDGPLEKKSSSNIESKQDEETNTETKPLTETIPEPFVWQIAQHSAGQPMYVEEALRLLHQQGILLQDTKTTRFSLDLHRQNNLGTLLLPTSLNEVIRERLAFLSEDARYLVQLASVCGFSVAHTVLTHLSQMKSTAFQKALDDLWLAGWLFPETSQSVQFRHPLIQNAILKTLPEAKRAKIHELIASYYLEMTKQQQKHTQKSSKQMATEETSDRLLMSYFHPSEMMYHLKRSDQPDVAKKLFHYGNLAAVFSIQLGDIVGANQLFAQTLEALQESGSNLDQTDQRLHQIRETLLRVNLTEYPDRTLKLMEPLTRASYFLDAPLAERLEILGVVATAYQAKGLYDKMLQVQQKAKLMVPAKEFPKEHISILLQQGNTLLKMGHWQSLDRLIRNQIGPLLGEYNPVGKGLVGSSDPLPKHILPFVIKTQFLALQVAIHQCDPKVEEKRSQLKKRIHQAEVSTAPLDVQLGLITAQLFFYQGKHLECLKQLEKIFYQFQSISGGEGYPENPVFSKESGWWSYLEGVSVTALKLEWHWIRLQALIALGQYQKVTDSVPEALRLAKKLKDYPQWLNLSALQNALPLLRRKHPIDEPLAKLFGIQQEDIEAYLMDMPMDMACAMGQPVWISEAISIDMMAKWAERQSLASTQLWITALKGQIAQRQQREEEAIRLWQEGLALAQQNGVGHVYEAIKLTNAIAQQEIQMGQLKQAGERLEPMWQAMSKTVYPALTAQTMGSIGYLYQRTAEQQDNPLLKQQALERSVEFFWKARNLWIKLNNRYQVSLVDELMAHANRSVA